MPLDGGKTLVAIFDGHGPNGHHAASKAKQFFEMAAPILMKDETMKPQVFFDELFWRCHSLLEHSGQCDSFSFEA